MLKGLVGDGPGSWKWLGTGDMVPHQSLHHIGFVVPKCFGSKKNIHQVVAADHLQDRGAGAEGATAAAPVSKYKTQKVWDRAWGWGAELKGQGQGQGLGALR